MKRIKFLNLKSILALVFVVTALVISNISVVADDYVAVTRNYNANYDEMLDDFSSSTPVGNPSVEEDYQSFPYLRVELDGAGHIDDKAIYKYASGNYLFHQLQIGLDIRLVEGTLPLSNMVLALRGNDAWLTHNISFDELLDGDGNPLDELTNEYQTLVFDVAGSIEDDSVVYFDKNTGEPTTTRVTDQVLGFHIINDEDTTAIVEIKRIFVIQAGVETNLDTFDRVDVNVPDENCWWRGSYGAIEPRHMILQNSSTYEVKDENKGEGFENIALRLKDLDGNGGVDLVVTPLYKDGSAGAPTTYTDLKDVNNNPLPLLTPTYNNVVINYANSGWDANVVGVKLSTPSKVALNQIFFTNFEEAPVASDYPLIDFININVFDTFNRTQSGFNGDYEASIVDPIVIKNGLIYTLSYNNGDKVKVEDGCLVYDATELEGSDWINFKEASTRAYNNEKYLVMKVKATDGASLERFEVNGVAGANWYSDIGLKVPSLDDASYPYTDGEWKYIIIDLALTGMSIQDNNTIDTYYRGTGKLFIDTIFFTNEYKIVPDTEHKYVVKSEEETADFSDGEYKYIYGGGANTNTSRFLAITMKGEEGTTLESFRIEQESKDGTRDFKWVKDNALVGLTVDALTTEYQVFYIDLVASGFDVANIAHLHFHFGAFEGHSGKISVNEVAYVDAVTYKHLVMTNESPVDFSDGSYKYFYGGGANEKEYPYLFITMKGSETTTFDSFRIEFEYKDGSKTDALWVKDGSLKGLVLENVATEYKTYIIDLEASGVDYINVAHLHIHLGAFEGHAGEVTFKEIGYLSETPTHFFYEDPDIVLPEITYDPANTANSGDTITVNPTVSDDVSSEDKITVVIEVTKGSGDEAEDVELDENNSFVAEVGVYTIKITAKDEAGNEATLTRQINVSEAPDTTKPTINLDLPTTIKVGDTVTLNPTISDDKSTSENITVTYEVKLGDEVVELDENNSFVAKSGTYTIKITATDEAENTETLTKTFTVEAAKSEPDNTWLIVGIVLVIVVLISVGGYFYLKKKQ